MKSKKLNINEKEYIVEKLPIGRFAELLKGINQLPKVLEGLDGVDNDKILSILPTLIADSLDDFIHVVAVGLQTNDKEVAETFGLGDMIESLTAIYEVNELKKVQGVLNPLFKRVGASTSGSVK